MKNPVLTPIRNAIFLAGFALIVSNGAHAADTSPGDINTGCFSNVAIKG
jgi:hypothetical protein